MNRPALLLDTHVWLWWLLGEPGLSPRERKNLDELGARAPAALCDISLWEAAMLVQAGRLQLTMALEEWVSLATRPEVVAVQAITPAIVAEMNRLPASFHRDPADRLIVSTARVLNIPVATRDRKIVQSGLVKIWKP